MEDINSTVFNFTTNSTSHSPGIMSGLAFCSISFLFGLPLHLYVIWLIFTNSGFETDFFNLNISVCEVGNCLTCLIDILSIWFSILKMLSQSLQGLAITGRPVFQCLICVERYLAVVHPVTFLKYKPLRYKMICSTVAWTITFGSCLYCVFIAIPRNSSFHVHLFSTQFLLFPFIQLCCVVAILIGLKLSGPGAKEKDNRMKRKPFNHILITTMAILLLIPYKIAAFISVQQHISTLWYIAAVGYLMDGFLQPILYLRRTGKIPCSS